jgi:hypothetical protein
MLESLHWGWGTFKAASSITGTAGISAIMITSGQTATIKAGSFIRVREII